MENITLENLQKEINLIKERNKKVEADKSWEISIERKITIGLLTYMIISLIMYYLNIDKPLVSAIIPTFGYILSTLSLGILKNKYIKKYLKNN
ncbi:MAG: hypothetical protein PHN31_03720 [Candidatus Gracilibacteria bacterium]|nr:hypothetical protein [Candidatus Gracilibacteria bacterium]